MPIYVSQLFTGLSVGSVLLLIALGLTFTFGQMDQAYDVFANAADNQALKVIITPN